MRWLGRSGQPLGLSALATEMEILAREDLWLKCVSLGSRGSGDGLRDVCRRHERCHSTEAEPISPHRTQTLQKAKSAYSNYRTNYDKINQFLCNIPNYEPQETDNIQQVEMKLKNQAVILCESALGSPGRGEGTTLKDKE